MTDKEVLRWIEKHVFVITRQANETTIYWHDNRGYALSTKGLSLKDCVSAAIEQEAPENSVGEV